MEVPSQDYQNDSKGENTWPSQERWKDKGALKKRKKKRAVSV